MSVNLTLALNIGTVIGAGLSTTVVADHPLVALALAFACGVGATVSSHYGVSVGPLHDDPKK